MSADDFQIEAKRMIDDQRRDREALVHALHHFSHNLLTLFNNPGRGD
jgi:hypothetical protein